MILDEIFARSKEELGIKKKRVSQNALEKKAERILASKNPPQPEKVLQALRKNADKFNIIAEVKKASPSKGIIRSKFFPTRIAQNYELNGAAAISVLTELHYFLGNLTYLEEIAQNAKVPLLRKDFIFDKYQILQSLTSKADFILLIARALSKGELKDLAQFARSLRLEVLFEIHNEADLDKALFAGASIIGINHRNLENFTLDMALCEKLMSKIPQDKIIVAESGLDKKDILRNLDALGVDAFLIGEYFMRQINEGKALKAFVKRT